MGFVVKGDKLSVSTWVDASSYVVFLRALFCTHQGSQGNNIFESCVEVKHPGCKLYSFMQICNENLHLFADLKS